jgi:GT2 family glycosyltransferase
METALIVLSYNHPQHTARAVASGLQAGCRNILLVHNGSQADHIAKLRGDFPEIRHLIIKENRGYAGGVNAGLSEAFKSCEWAVLLTNDSELESWPSIPNAPAIVAPLVFRKKADRVDSLGGHFIPGRARLRHCRGRGDFDQQASTSVRRYIPGTAFLVHREVFESSRGLDERLCIYWDDVDWSVRIEALGFPLQVDPEWKVRHRVGKTAHGKPLYSLYYFQRNRRLISWRYARGLERVPLSVVLAGEWVRLTWRLLRSRRFGDLRYIPRIIGESLPADKHSGGNQRAPIRPDVIR